ncbi:DUF192 domain-containing protein [Neokomagataea tanensis]|uniref:DUF192 domain-containing protein n=1 Tax=Neokomagataea tanensis TaxID=661191 RepID=A0A4Y6V3W0_9PROT|nr:DUF192 domain-containing protein [Neokomagataea tanensis]QDH24633.1 DUF192 domain-containing protein [Neokomagataea tanensis]
MGISKIFPVFAGILGASFFVAPVHAEEPITQPQAKLPVQDLTITSHDGQAHVFHVEMAFTPRQQEIGEMFRQHLPEDEGMLFVWPRPQGSDMWMRNTLVPLDIVFIDDTHHIHAIVENAVPLSEAILSSQGFVASTLELAGGVTEKMDIRVGDVVSGPAINAKSRP